ncbi:hypothetical protein BKA69DRAFT_1042778 [Paraphysoderma sedebokerense]|nr:hypothetical protein BKA69DRAFT_1042778 [Paraphysoderma sedebokerense]
MSAPITRDDVVHGIIAGFCLGYLARLAGSTLNQPGLPELRKNKLIFWASIVGTLACVLHLFLHVIQIVIGRIYGVIVVWWVSRYIAEQAIFILLLERTFALAPLLKQFSVQTQVLIKLLITTVMGIPHLVNGMVISLYFPRFNPLRNSILLVTSFIYPLILIAANTALTVMFVRILLEHRGDQAFVQLVFRDKRRWAEFGFDALVQLSFMIFRLGIAFANLSYPTEMWPLLWAFSRAFYPIYILITIKTYIVVTKNVTKDILQTQIQFSNVKVSGNATVQTNVIRDHISTVPSSC